MSSSQCPQTPSALLSTSCSVRMMTGMGGGEESLGRRDWTEEVEEVVWSVSGSRLSKQRLCGERGGGAKKELGEGGEEKLSPRLLAMGS